MLEKCDASEELGCGKMPAFAELGRSIRISFRLIGVQLSSEQYEWGRKMSESTNSFGEQAARFSLYAPFTVLLIGVITFGNRNQPGVAIAVAVINLLLIAAGFVFGIIALFSMRRFGRSRIMGRAVAGLLLNGLVIAACVSFTLPLIMFSRARSQMIGHWHVRTKPGVPQIDVTFNKDGTIHFVILPPAAPAISMDGRWEMSQDRSVVTTIAHVTGSDRTSEGKTIGLGHFKSATDHELVMGTDHDDEIYDRVP